MLSDSLRIIISIKARLELTSRVARQRTSMEERKQSDLVPTKLRLAFRLRIYIFLDLEVVH